MKLSERARAIKPSPTFAVEAKAREMRARGIDVIGFGAGEPDFDTPEHIRDAGIDAINSGFTRYTPTAGIPELKEAIVAKLRRDNGLDYEPSQIIVSCGAKHSLYNAFQVLCGPGDEVIIPAPYWVSYPDQVKLVNAQMVVIPSTVENEFKITPAALRKACEESPSAKVLLLNSPSNPSGTVYNREELTEIAKICIEYNLLVISDEIYERLVYDDTEHVSIASVLPEMYERTVVINGVSKAYAMTGWRMGYAAGPAHIIGAASRVQAHATSGINSITQKASVVALNEEDDSIEKMRQEFQERRNFLCGELSKIPHVTLFKPKGAFYVFPDISWYLENNNKGIKDCGEFCSLMLETYHVALVSGAAFGVDTAVRFSYANSMENLKKGAQRFAKCLEDLRS
ncbi:MAG TPA: aspartate aminotransferase [Candidatus Cloacimonas sp.]|nr:aspartate aminotransferase [Candidatus Cloacimonas sp.]